MHHQVDEYFRDRQAELMDVSKEQRAGMREFATGRRLVLRDKIEDVANYIKQSTPFCSEQSHALAKLTEAQMWANKANERGE